MKTVFKVARTELRVLFYSPIAWFLMIVFLIQCGATYLGLLQTYVRMQETGGPMLQYLRNLTEYIFTSPSGLFNSIMQKLYLYIPLLTMGLISRETSSGTIKLLYSSPLKVRTIVFGKYLAMMIYSLLLVAIITIFIVLGLKNIVNVQGGMLASSLLGFYLLLCAYSAIGLFMSCLTTYQVVAAISTFVMIGILSYIGTLWQGIDFVRDLTYFLSIAGRTEKMLSGLITTKDVLYFLLIVYIFVGLSILKLKAGRESKSALVKTGRYLAVVFSALLIGYITSRPSLIGYYDATVSKSRTLTPKVQGIIKELGTEQLEVNTYVNMLDNFQYLGNPEARNRDLARWEPYIRFKNDIKVNYIQYYDSTLDARYMARMYPGKTLKEVAEQYAKAADKDLEDFKTPEEIHKIIDLKPELNRYVMQLKYKDRSTFLRVFDDPQVWPGETEVSAAIKRLLQAKLPKVAFLTGDFERDINKGGDKEFKALTNLKTFRYSLINQGFDVDTLTLEGRDVPSDISTLVLADPKMELQPASLAKLQKYIDQGGNLLFLGEPNKQQFLNPIIKQFGVQLSEGMIIQESRDGSPDLAMARVTPYAATFTKELAKRQADSMPVSMPGTVSLSYTNAGVYTIQPLLMTDARHSWNKMKKIDLDMVTGARSGNGPRGGFSSFGEGDDAPAAAGPKPDTSAGKTAKPPGTITGATGPVRGGMYRPGSDRGRGASMVGTVTFAPEEGDTRGPLATGVSLTRAINGKEQRIVIIGDADCMSNSELRRSNVRTANFSFNTALFSWLSYGEFPIDASRPDPKDNRVTVSNALLKKLKLVFLWILPGILVAFGTILLIRRKRK